MRKSEKKSCKELINSKFYKYGIIVTLCLYIIGINMYVNGDYDPNIIILYMIIGQICFIYHIIKRIKNGYWFNIAVILVMHIAILSLLVVLLCIVVELFRGFITGETLDNLRFFTLNMDLLYFKVHALNVLIILILGITCVTFSIVTSINYFVYKKVKKI